MYPRVSHDRKDESLEAKARWFQSLSPADRMEVFCSFTDLALTLNPSLARKGIDRDAQQTEGRVRVIRLPQDRRPG